MKTYMLMAAVLLLAVSCSGDPDPIPQVKEPGSVISAKSDEPARAGQPFKIDERFYLPNSCSSFDSFETWKEVDTLVVKVWAIGPGAAACPNKNLTNDLRSLMHTFATPGTHYLKFVKNNGYWYRDTITVIP